MEKNENIVTNANKSGYEKRNVPTLRFKTFEQKWEYSTIGECSISLEYGMNSAAIKYDGKHKYIRITDIDEETNAFIPNPLSSPDGELDEKYLVKENDILFARTGASVGKSYLYNNNDGELYFAGFLIRARIKSDYNGTFIYYQTKSKKYDRWVRLTSMRSGQPGINSQEYSSYPIALTSKDEQDKIADFLQMLDNRISVQNKIISKYETLIKGLCDLLLSNTNTEILPLKSIATINKGQQINGLALAKTGEYYYLNGGISPSGYVQEYNTSENIISISEGGNSCGFVAYNTQKFWSGGHCYTLKIINTKCRSKFLYFYLKHREKDIMQLRVGSGLPNIQKRSLENFAVALPSVEKQYYIEHVLECITAKKEIEIDLLGQFQSQKKFLLSKMFI